jgi:glyoxylase-like metal-dependent hydrolase (beta-lactamase superfamily II)
MTHPKFALVLAIFAQAAWSQPPEIQVLPVQGNVYMLVSPSGNIAIQAGKDGALLVDTPPPMYAQAVMAEIRKLTAKPLRNIINTSGDADRVSGNGAIAILGQPGLNNTRQAATIIAQESVLDRLTKEKAPEAVLPLDEYFLPTKDFYFNGEPVIIFHAPKAHTDGDSIVFFRRSDVLAVGDIFNPIRYPIIDLAHGGSVKGLIDALNHILRLTVPERLQDGGTRVIPAHGRLCNEADVVEYREMVTIIRDRIQDMLKRGMNLAAVKNAKPSLDYDPQYGNPDAFVEAVYRSLGGK